MFDDESQKCIREGSYGSCEHKVIAQIHDHIKKNNVADKCRHNEYLGCGDLLCAKFCGSSRDPICDLSRFKCDYGCFCKPGYIKVIKQHCIRIEECKNFYYSD